MCGKSELKTHFENPQANKSLDISCRTCPLVPFSVRTNPSACSLFWFMLRWMQTILLLYLTCPFSYFYGLVFVLSSSLYNFTVTDKKKV